MSQVVLIVLNFLLWPLRVLAGLISWVGGIATRWLLILYIMLSRWCSRRVSRVFHPSSCISLVGLTSLSQKDFLYTTLAALRFTLSGISLYFCVWGSHTAALYLILGLTRYVWSECSGVTCGVMKISRDELEHRVSLLSHWTNLFMTVEVLRNNHSQVFSRFHCAEEFTA